MGSVVLTDVMRPSHTRLNRIVDEHCRYCDLSLAAHSGDAAGVERFIDLGADPAAEVACNNALASAIVRGHIDIVRLLLDRGADPNRLDPMQCATPLQLAVARDAASIVPLLIERGAGTDAIDMFPIVRSGASLLVKQLIDLGICVAKADKETGRTLLHEAAMYGYADLVSALTTAGVDPTRRDKWGNTAAHLALRNGHTIVGLTSLGHESGEVMDT